MGDSRKWMQRFQIICEAHLYMFLFDPYIP